jgi:hypothetical protein
MADEIGPLAAQFKACFYNRANLREVLKVAGASAGTYQPLVTALAGTASDYLVTATQEGTTNHWFASLPSPLNVGFSQPVGLFPADAADIDDSRRKLIYYTPDPQFIAGAYPITIAVNDSDSGDPIEGATVRITGGSTGAGGSTAVFTNADGEALFSRNAGTYSISILAVGYDPVAVEHVVSSTTSTWLREFDLDVIDLPAPGAGQTTAFGYTRDAQGTVETSKTVQFRLVDPAGTTDAYRLNVITVVSHGTTGLFSALLLKSSICSASNRPKIGDHRAR